MFESSGAQGGACARRHDAGGGFTEEWRALCRQAGRTFDSVGGGRHAKQNPTDLHRQRKREFAKTVIAELRRAMLSNRFDRPILVAPPAFLGDLRDALSKDLRNKVADEIASDLTNMPKQELPMRLAAMLARSPSGDGARSAKRQVCTGTNRSVIGPRSTSTTDLQVG